MPEIDLAGALDDATLELLRLEPKKKSSLTRAKEKMGHIEQHFELVSLVDPARNFSVYTRLSKSNPQVFSVGLRLLLPDKDLLLCRYNSGHHPHRNKIEKIKIAAVPHRHIATARYIVAGLDPDGYAEPWEGYSTMQGALAMLVHDCNVQGILKPPDRQLNLGI